MVDHYQQGRLKEAESGLLEIQRLEPDIPKVLHLLALIAIQTDRAGEAVGQAEPGDWADVIGRVRRELATRATG